MTHPRGSLLTETFVGVKQFGAEKGGETVLEPDGRAPTRDDDDEEDFGGGRRAAPTDCGRPARRPAARPVGVHYGGGLRGDLIRAALELIEAKGADRLSLREVARRVGVSWAAPAYHFGNKEGLFTAIALGGFQILTDRVMNTPPIREGQDPDRLGNLAELYVEFATEHPARFEVMCRRGLVRSEDPRIPIAEDRLFLALGYLIAMSQLAGWRSDDDTEALVATAWSLAHGYCALRAQGGLALQRFGTPPPAVEELTAALVGRSGPCTLAPCASHGGEGS
jgi:AcrR family transcriptional regulator